MRTTVTLDPDAEQIVREAMAAKGLSFKQALNDAIRAGARARVDVAFNTPTLDMGKPAVDVTKALALAGELEDKEIVGRLRAGR